MNVIRFREIVVCIVAACSVYACATGSTSPGGGGEGGEGGDSWGGPASSSSNSGSGSSGSGSSGSGSSGSSSGSSGSTVCDMTTSDCPTCAACSDSSADGLCVEAFNDCYNDVDCYDLLSCLASCPSGDSACSASCETSYSAGIPLFTNYLSCVICQDCYVKCDGANSCN